MFYYKTETCLLLINFGVYLRVKTLCKIVEYPATVRNLNFKYIYNVNNNRITEREKKVFPAWEITVGHRTLSDQNSENCPVY